MSEFLFVYGTLSRHARHEMHGHLAKRADYVADACLNGRLYRIANYPGAVASSDPQDKVFGELYRLRSPHEVFAQLDDYEGSDFVRQKAPIEMQDGSQAHAWVYLFKGSVSGLPRIPSGRFTAE
jgi:gamma-glutamylcyclotransferase (GGCT)/AIG2-like uncharacterized protein YtfP